MTSERSPAGVESVSSEQVLLVTWQDGTVTTIPWTVLRLSCPCAGCQGELGSPGNIPESAGQAKIVDILMMGYYALQPVWSDGHSTGIYTWDYLWEIGQALAHDSGHDQSRKAAAARNREDE